jgi:polar amino acid transport system permease protein
VRVATVQRGELAPDIVVESDELRAVRARHPGRWVAGAIVLVLAGALVKSVANNPRFEWDVVRQYLFAEPIIDGLRATIVLTVLAMAIGVALGTALAVMRMSPNPLVSMPARLYIEFFRGTPLLVQVIFWFNIAALYPSIGIGVPFIGHSLVDIDAKHLLTPYAAGLAALATNEGAYMAEIVRAGFLSVDEGQTDAAQALGMNRLRITRRIILPQAMRVIIPPTGNEAITMLKSTSLVSVIAVTELFYTAQVIYARTYQTIPLLIVICVWYLTLTSLLSAAQRRIERHYARGAVRTTHPTRSSRMWGRLGK